MNNKPIRSDNIDHSALNWVRKVRDYIIYGHMGGPLYIEQQAPQRMVLKMAMAGTILNIIVQLRFGNSDTDALPLVLPPVPGGLISNHDHDVILVIREEKGDLHNLNI